MISSPRLDERFRLSSSQAQDLAKTFGTPLYVVDEAHFRERIRRYRSAFLAVDSRTSLTYASKANSTLALLRIAYEEGCDIDVASEGELRAALAAGVPASACHFHGNNKSFDELSFAVEAGVGFVVADHFGELEMLGKLHEGSDSFPKIVLRLAPGVDPVTHAKISTGQADTKFGFNLSDGSAERATLQALELSLPLIGYHCHVGSQLLDPEAQRSGGELLAQFATAMRDRHGFAALYINVGGGLGVRYTDRDQPISVEEFCRLIVQSIRTALAGSGLDPVLGQEPGRSLIAESGVTLYRVGVVKTVPAKERGTRTYVAVDGGLSDNPRPAMYGSPYTVERVFSAAGWTYVTDGPGAVAGTVEGDSAIFTVSGKHCETDKLFEDISLPADLTVGDLLQVLTTGAYNASMASNYNRYPRPATVLIRSDGSFFLAQRRESWDELFARENLP